MDDKIKIDAEPAKRIAAAAKDLYNAFIDEFGDSGVAVDMTIAAMPSICAEVHRSLRPRIVFRDTAESLEESGKIDDDYVPTSRGTTNEDERKNALQALVDGIFKKASSERRRWPL